MNTNLISKTRRAISTLFAIAAVGFTASCSKAPKGAETSGSKGVSAEVKEIANPGSIDDGGDAELAERVDATSGGTTCMTPTVHDARPSGRPQMGGSPQGQDGPLIQQSKAKYTARGSVVRFEEWTDPKTGQRIKKQTVVPAGTPPRMKGKKIETEPTDAFVNGANGERLHVPAGREVPDDIMQAIFRKQQQGR